MKVIIDTNIWISFLLGHQVQLVRQILTDLSFEVYVCERLIEEIRDVAGRDKIRKHLGPNDFNDLLSIIQAFCKFAFIEAQANSNVVRDPKDLYLLALADTIGASYIISGDTDLTDIGQYKQTKIINLSDFRALML